MAMLTKSRALSELAGYGPGAFMKVSYGFHVIGTQEPYFSITADITTPRSRRLSDIEVGGCLHEDIQRYFPELAELIPFHLSFVRDGKMIPSHYVANADYWCRLALGIKDRWSSSTQQPPEEARKILSRHCQTEVIGDEEELGRRLMAYRAAHSNGCPDSAKLDFQKWLESRIPIMTEKMTAMMEKHGIKVEDAEVTRRWY